MHIIIIVIIIIIIVIIIIFQSQTDNSIIDNKANYKILIFIINSNNINEFV